MKSRGRMMVPVPANADSGIQGPAQTLHPDHVGSLFCTVRYLYDYCPSQNILDNTIYRTCSQTLSKKWPSARRGRHQ